MPRILTPAAALPARATGAPFFPNAALFTANGSFVPPANVTLVYVTGVAGGGGGGAGGGSGVVGSGAAGGEGVIRRPVAVTPGNTYPITVGAGGAGGIFTTSTPGVTGGATSFGSDVTLRGGAGATQATAGANAATQGNASAFAHPLNTDLQSMLAGPFAPAIRGQDGTVQSGGVPGAGGASVLSALTANTSVTPIGVGAGGAGGLSFADGAPGRAGALLVEW
jgi:hypothetical protein